MGITNLNVRHVKVDPRSRTALQRAVDISKFKAAVVLCGELPRPCLCFLCASAVHSWLLTLA